MRIGDWGLEFGSQTLTPAVSWGVPGVRGAGFVMPGFAETQAARRRMTGDALGSLGMADSCAGEGSNVVALLRPGISCGRDGAGLAGGCYNRRDDGFGRGA